VPQADEEAFAFPVGQTGVGIAVLAEAQQGGLVGRLDGQEAHGPAPRPGNVKRLARGVTGDPARNELVRLRHDAQLAVLAEIAAGEVEGVDDLVLAAAGKEALAVGREAESVERLVEGGAADDPLPLQVNDDDLVLAVAAVQGGQPAAVGMQGEVDREVAEEDL